MNYRLVIGFVGLLLVSSLAAFANEYGDWPEVKAITKGQPKDVVALIERIAECHHWGGEEPYDKARGEEIRKAADKAGCSRLDSDEGKLLKKYKSNNRVSGALEKAKRLAL